MVKIEIHFINGSFISYESDMADLEQFSKNTAWISKGNVQDIWINPDNVLYILRVK